MNIAIFANGEYGNKEFYINELKNIGYVIGVDGGNEFLKKINLHPNLCIGDFDSTSKETLKWLSNTRMKTFPKDKDKSDTYLALEYASRMKADSIYVFGGLGKRIDHTYSNLLLFSVFDFVVKEENIEIFRVRDHKVFKCQKGETWSLLPLKEVHGLTIEGFKYPAENMQMFLENPIGLSNITIKENVSISLKKGILIVFRNRL